MKLIMPFIASALLLSSTFSQAADDISVAIREIKIRISPSTPIYDGYMLGSKFGKYQDLKCKTQPKSRFYPVAETVCSSSRLTHTSNGPFAVVAEELIYRQNILAEIYETMDTPPGKLLVTQESVVAKLAVGQTHIAIFTVAKNIKSRGTRGVLRIRKR